MTKLLLAAASATAVVMAGTAALAAPATGAEPMRLDETQMDGVSAGAVNLNIAVAVPTQVIVPTAVAVNVGSGTASAGNIVNAVQVAAIRQKINWN
ncbi:hypothetical protein [Caulobacter sp. 17J80-11]|uniref:hypothetical protein n=1 Tax=Caulobacter sp. 17J80-11 TaxID=2763502 RepID=UPI001653D598|nr:hypothetical protein [Caulobacter sp. 17J80-11]MBC6980518.1 hypothetical protein [Caulobacter sp. 17J80-11]